MQQMQMHQILITWFLLSDMSFSRDKNPNINGRRQKYKQYIGSKVYETHKDTRPKISKTILTITTISDM